MTAEPTDPWITANELAHQLGCSAAHARRLLLPHAAGSRMQGRARAYPPAALAAALSSAPNCPWAAPGELTVPQAAAQLEESPLRVYTALRALGLSPSPRRTVGTRIYPYLTPEQLTQVAAYLSRRRAQARAAHLGGELALARQAARQRAAQEAREGRADLHRAGWRSLEAAALTWGLSAGAAADRLWPHLHHSQHVPAGPGQPRELWFSPEALAAAAPR